MENLYTEKTADEILRPLAQYSGDDNYVKGLIYSLNNGGNLYDYARNYGSYKNALEASKGNDSDNFFTGIGDIFVGRDDVKQKADIADEFLKAYGDNPYEFGGSDYQEAINSVKTGYDPEKGTYIHGGILGTLLNPFTQTATAAGDALQAIGGDSSDWDKRDKLSDLGATLSTILNLASFGNLGSAANLGAKIATGAGLGGLDNAAYTLFEKGKNVTPDELASSAAMGAAFGGGIPVLGAVGSKLGSAVTNKGVDAIANQAVQQGYAPELARQITQNTSKASQAAAGLGQVMRSKPFKIGAGAVAGGTLLSNLMGNRNANQTGYNDDATYGSDLYGTTQGYNYGTYGY